MNKSRRSRIDTIIEQIDNLLSDLNEIRDEEESAYENLPESLQDTDRGQSMCDAIDSIEEALDCLEEASSVLDDAKGD